MNLKKSLENRVRGWLPKEPNLPSYRRKNYNKTWRTQQRFVIPFIMGAFIGALSGALYSFIGLSGLGAFAYFVIIGTATGIAVAVILILTKQKEERQRNAQKLKT